MEDELTLRRLALWRLKISRARFLTISSDSFTVQKLMSAGLEVKEKGGRAVKQSSRQQSEEKGDSLR